jgi:hypothetical protein
MGLLDSAVAIADKITQSLGLQTVVSHQTITVFEGNGNRIPGAVVSCPAIVVKKQQLVKTANGEMVMSQAYVTFLSPIVIGLYDIITLPDGTTGPILNTEGFVAAVNPILTEVWLG